MGFKNIVLTDSPILRSALEDSFLDREGFVLLPSTGADATFSLVLHRDPVLVLLDLSMPGMAECSRRLKSDPVLRDTPVLLIPEKSGLGEAVGDAVLVPPVHPRQIHAAASRLLNIHQRGEPRVTTRFPARFGPQGTSLNRGLVLNMSQGGLFLRSDFLFPSATPLSLDLELPQAERALRVEGRVAWVNHPEWIKKPELPPGMGVQFCSLVAENQHLLLRWLRKAGLDV